MPKKLNLVKIIISYFCLSYAFAQVNTEWMRDENVEKILLYFKLDFGYETSKMRFLLIVGRWF